MSGKRKASLKQLFAGPSLWLLFDLCIIIFLVFQVTITPRMILSHLSGIRHYEKDIKKVREDREKARRPLKQPDKEEKSTKENTEDTKTEASCTKQNQKKKEFEQEEYYLKDGFDSVIQALDLFKYDPLVFKPGKVCPKNNCSLMSM